MIKGTLTLKPDRVTVFFVSHGTRASAKMIDLKDLVKKALLNAFPKGVEVWGEPEKKKYQLQPPEGWVEDHAQGNPVGNPRGNPGGDRYTVTDYNNGEPRTNPLRPSRSTVQTTDPYLGKSVGTSYEFQKPFLRVAQFSPNVAELAGKVPDINRNPYNFVAFGEAGPWEERAPAGGHPGHDKWSSDLHSGTVTLCIVPQTPVFVPEGFPFIVTGEKVRSAQQKISRRFCRMRRADGRLCYSIPGSSWKGVLRSEVEALANSRMGEVNTKEYEKPLPYRRRVFRTGLITNTKQIEEAEAYWFRYPVPSVGEEFYYKLDARRIVVSKTDSGARRDVVRSDDVVKSGATFGQNLLALPAKGHNYSAVLLRRSHRKFSLDTKVLECYTDNLEHEHYENHLKNPKIPGTYTQPPEIENARARLRVPNNNDLVFFTEKDGKVTSFGKNVNYLWPAGKKVQELAAPFYPRSENSLQNDLGIAERLFGFAAPHAKEGGVSHPFRGKLRFETLWGPPVDDDQHAVRLQLAPLTAPKVRAKARPLYLVEQQGGGSGTYDQPKPELKGRKFYWHQNASASPDGVASFHLRQPEHDEVESQLPPPLLALKPGLERAFTGRIHFDNVSVEELGCLLVALEGWDTANYLKIGKAKPRGLGSVKCSITTLETFKAAGRYTDLFHEEATPPAVSKGDLKTSFRSWTQQKAGNRPSRHLQDWERLHTWPEQQSIRYYPVNFSQYSWMTNDNVNPDTPRDGRYPPAMKRARDVKP